MKLNLMLAVFAALSLATTARADHHEQKKAEHVHKHDKSCKHKDKEGKCEDHHKGEKMAEAPTAPAEAPAPAPAADPHKH
jgi:uncharacterized low-complexity protein